MLWVCVPLSFHDLTDSRLHQPLPGNCLLLCKICLGGIQQFFPNDKIRLEITKESTARRLSRRLAGVGMIKMLRTPGFHETTPNHRAEPVQIWKARKFIEEHSEEELSLRRVAKAVNISANHLSEKFKQVTGINFVDYVARVRFEEARDLLLNSNRRISEIAFAAGFQSLSQFNRLFKRISGKSPTQYRAAKGNGRRRR